jgi:hypothetical protein
MNGTSCVPSFLQDLCLPYASRFMPCAKEMKNSSMSARIACCIRGHVAVILVLSSHFCEKHIFIAVFSLCCLSPRCLISNVFTLMTFMSFLLVNYPLARFLFDGAWAAGLF